MISPKLLERVAAAAAGIGADDGVGAQILEHRAGRQRAVLEYRFDAGLRLFAKRYERREDALRSYDVLRLLVDQGFGPGSRHRVPEPLGCFEDWGVLVVGAAPGRCASGSAVHSGDWDEGLRAAAGWLARLHSLPVGSVPGEDDRTQAVFRLARRAAGAAARRPALEDLLVQLLEELAGRAGGSGPHSRTLTHGRYHPEHVFVTAAGAVTVIDLDRAGPADPAKDLGEFVHRTRTQARRARLGTGAADRATLTFLEEYGASAGAVPETLVYYWSYSILWTLLRMLERDHAKWEKRLAFYRGEFEEVPRSAEALGRLAAVS